MRYYPILLTTPVVAACGPSYEPGATYQADAHGTKTPAAMAAKDEQTLG